MRFPRIMSGNKGFSLIEVLIAITIFSIFISAYVVSQGQNLNDSIQMQEEIILKKLTEQVLQEAILNPPEYSPSLEQTPQEKRFEDDNYENYRYTVEYKQVEIPDLSELIGSEEESEDSGDAGVRKRIYDQFKDNIQKMVWQIRVTVTNQDTGFNYILSSWVKNKKAVVKVSL